MREPEGDFFACDTEEVGRCRTCGRELVYGEWFAIDEDGNYFCVDCAEAE